MSEFIRNIIAGVLIITLAGIVSPAKDYKNQIRLICSLIFTCMIVGAFSGIINNYANNISVFHSGEISYSERNEAYADCIEYVIEGYKNDLAAEMKNRLYSEDIAAEEIVLCVREDPDEENFGEIISVKLEGCEEHELEHAKKIINSFYNVEYENIYN